MSLRVSSCRNCCQGFFFNGFLRIPCHLCGLPGVLSLMAGGEDAVGSSPATQTLKNLKIDLVFMPLKSGLELRCRGFESRKCKKVQTKKAGISPDE